MRRAAASSPATSMARFVRIQRARMHKTVYFIDAKQHNITGNPSTFYRYLKRTHPAGEFINERHAAHYFCDPSQTNITQL